MTTKTYMVISALLLPAGVAAYAQTLASRACAYCAPNGWRELPRILPVITGAILKPAAVALAMFAHATVAAADFRG